MTGCKKEKPKNKEMQEKEKLVIKIGDFEQYLNVEDFEQCFFCDRKTIPLDFEYSWNLEMIGKIREFLGSMPERKAGKIGNKVICKTCVIDLEGLLD